MSPQSPVSGLRLTVDGAEQRLAPEPERSLLSALRDELDVSGPKDGCGEGACGACTVLLDGRPVRACVVPVAAADGRAVTTAGGLAQAPAEPLADTFEALERAFIAEVALQCGYCTPGMVLAAAALLADDPDPTDDGIRSALEGNVCRCGVQPRIVLAVQRAARELREGPPAGTAAAVVDRQDHGLGLAGTVLDHVVARAETVQTSGSALGPWDRVPPDRRGFFDLLGDGLVAAVDPASEERTAERGLPPAGAWVHVGADGRVTAFSGKVDVGQGTRTALAVIAARELRVPLETVGLVMGDTDLCPYDMGTFASRSMPDAAPAMRAASRLARTALLRLASERWEVAPTDLDAIGGTVRTRDSARTATYAELLAGRRLVESALRDPDAEARATDVDPPPMPDAAPSPAPPALAETISGRRRYVSDLRLPGMLHGRVLRPPVPGATLRSVDLRAALAQPSLIVAAEQDFVGVAAADPATAERALAAVEATWDVPDLPSEADLEAYLRTHPIEQEGWGGTLDESSGDVEAALAGSTVRHEATYTTAYVAHVPAETRCALAEWRDGRLSVWVGTQVPFGVRAGLAQAFGLAIEDVRVVAGPTGSAFGGKADAGVAVEAARLAQAAGRPVRVKWSREEEFRAGYLRPAAVIDVRAGLGAQGDLAAWSMTTFNAGPNALAGPYAAGAFALRFQPTARPLPQGAYRALAATANTFARESHLDELARRAGQDPLAFRLRHLADERLAAVLRAAADQVGWGRPDARPQGMGLGLACGLEKGGRVATVAQVRAALGERLELVRLVTAIECGAIVEPAALRSQVEGGTVMALGPALGEVIHFTAGRITNARLADYAVPRFVGLPRIEVVLLDRPDLPSAGAGEVPLISVAPAIANAIRDACGLRLTALPLVPDGVVAPGT